MSLNVKVSFRKDRNKYQVTYFVGGQRKRPLFSDRLKAENFARSLVAGSPTAGGINISDAIREYYEDHSKMKKGKQSTAGDKRHLNLLYHFMTEVRGVHFLEEIRYKDVEAFQTWLSQPQDLGDGETLDWSASTVNRAFNTIKHFFKKHVQWEHIKASPCAELDNLPTDPGERRPMRIDEYMKAYEQAPDWFKPVFEFIRLTGVPASCIERMTWPDVDFDEGTFVIQRKKGREAKLRRITLPMTAQVRTLLLTLRNKNKNCVNVFLNNEKKPLKADHCSKTANRAIKDAGLVGVTNYCLRHALATEMTEANESLRLAQLALGHASMTTTVRYTKKANMAPVREAIERVRGEVVANLVATDKIKKPRC